MPDEEQSGDFVERRESMQPRKEVHGDGDACGDSGTCKIMSSDVACDIKICTPRIRRNLRPYFVSRALAPLQLDSTPRTSGLSNAEKKAQVRQGPQICPLDQQN